MPKQVEAEQVENAVIALHLDALPEDLLKLFVVFCASHPRCEVLGL